MNLALGENVDHNNSDYGHLLRSYVTTVSEFAFAKLIFLLHASLML